MAVKITLTGALRTTLHGVEGQTLRRLFLNTPRFQNKSYEGYTFKDEKGKPVSLDRKVSADLKIVATESPKADAPQAATAATETAPAATPVAAQPAAAPAAVAAPKPLVADVIATPGDEKITITLTGKLTGTFSGAKGSTLNDLLKIGKISPTGSTFSDSNGRTYALTTKIDESVTLNTASRVSGG